MIFWKKPKKQAPVKQIPLSLIHIYGERIKDVDSVVGAESLTHFGEYEDDSVFVRNDRLKCDYEILMDTRTYSEILKERPHQREV